MPREAGVYVWNAAAGYAIAMRVSIVDQTSVHGLKILSRLDPGRGGEDRVSCMHQWFPVSVTGRWVVNFCAASSEQGYVGGRQESMVMVVWLGGKKRDLVTALVM